MDLYLETTDGLAISNLFIHQAVLQGIFSVAVSLLAYIIEKRSAVSANEQITTHK